MTDDKSGEKASSARKSKKAAKDFDRDRLIKELGKKLVLNEDFVTDRSLTGLDGKEYGVMIYYNGSVAPVK